MRIRGRRHSGSSTIVEPTRHSVRRPSRSSYCLSPAFTLIEVVVSIGVLSILLLMAGTIFALTMRSSGQATALVEVSDEVRALEQSLREDLRYVQPDSSLMVIAGNRVNAYWTQDEEDADADHNPLNGYPHSRDPRREYIDADGNVQPELPRADVLMFFTARPGSSYVSPEVSGHLQQVVYGHAELGTINPARVWTPDIAPNASDELMLAAATVQQDTVRFTGNASQPYTTVPSPAKPPPAPLPAEDWQLTRRSVLILDQPAYEPPLGIPPSETRLDPALDLNDDFQSSEKDKHPLFYDLPRVNFVRDGRRDYLVNDYDANSFSYQWDVIWRVGQLSRVVGDYNDPVCNAYPNLCLPAIEHDPPAGYTRAAVAWMQRTLLDPTPPVRDARRLGAYMLPHCASFKVEWALQLDSAGACGEIIWVDPGDLASTIRKMQARIDGATADALTYGVYTGCPCAEAILGHEPSGCPLTPKNPEGAIFKLLPTNPIGDPRTLDPYPVRFADFNKGQDDDGVPRPVHVFYPRKLPRAQEPVLDVPDPLFPKALRITVDVYDPAGRLQRPVRHVMVLPVGGG